MRPEAGGVSCLQRARANLIEICALLLLFAPLEEAPPQPQGRKRVAPRLAAESAPITGGGGGSWLCDFGGGGRFTRAKVGADRADRLRRRRRSNSVGAAADSLGFTMRSRANRQNAVSILVRSLSAVWPTKRATTFLPSRSPAQTEGHLNRLIPPPPAPPSRVFRQG